MPTAFSDNESGDGKDNIIDMLGGDDTYKGRGGDDTIEGGDGNDSLTATMARIPFRAALTMTGSLANGTTTP